MCILTGKYSWNVTCELTLLNNDGNLLDAFNFAAIICLFRFKLPFVSIEEGRLKVHSFEEKRPQTLSIHHLPISMTFALMTQVQQGEEKEYLVFDPTKSEEEIFDGRISITLNVYKDICGIHYPGGCNLKPVIIKE